MKDLTLLILAAGMGSRFGGLKQIEPVGPNGEFIIDYSIYDAIHAGFNKVVFIIKKENLEIFRETIGKRIEDKIKVEYAFQDLEEAKNKYNLSEDREKPLGTTHALICAKDKIKGPFVMINADDYYGKQAFMDAVNFIKESNSMYGAVLYNIENTLTENGSVKRGICQIENGKLVGAIESVVEKINNEIIATPLDENEIFKVSANTAASMNMFILHSNIFDLLECRFNECIKENKDNLTYEALIIQDLFYLIENKKIEISAFLTKSKWYGITYQEDKESVKKALKQMVDNQIYPNNLWR